MCEGYEASEQWKSKHDYFRSIRAIIAWHAKDYEEALAQLRKLNDKLDPVAVYEMAVTSSVVITETHVQGGNAKALIEQAQLRLLEENWNEAGRKVAEAAQLAKDDAVVQAYLRLMSSTIEMRRKMADGKWVDLQFDEELTGWTAREGKWRRKDPSTLIGRADGKALHISYNLPIGHRFEYKGEVSIPNARYNSDNAGPSFCEAEVPLPRMRSFLVNPTKKELAMRRGLIHGEWETSEHILPQRNAFVVTVWDKSVTVRLNGEVVHRGQWLNPDEDFGKEEFIGLGGHFWYEGSDVVFRNLQVRRLTEPPTD
jgi:hypothetical protein